jgi:hypothetical protein
MGHKPKADTDGEPGRHDTAPFAHVRPTSRRVRRNGPLHHARGHDPRWRTLRRSMVSTDWGDFWGYPEG